MWLKIPVDMVWRREELCRRVEPSPWARSSEPMSSVSSCSSSVIASLKSLLASARLYSAIVAPSAETAITSAVGPPVSGGRSTLYPSASRPERRQR